MHLPRTEPKTEPPTFTLRRAFTGRVRSALRPAAEAITRVATIALVVGLVTLPRPSQAQTPAQVQGKLEQSGHTTPEVQQRIRASGLSPDQVRQALQERGLSPSALDQYMPGGTAGKPTQPATSQPPSDALTAPAETLKESAPARPLELLPENLPEFTKEIAKRVPAAALVLPFGYEIFHYTPTTFEPLGAGPVDPDYPIGPGDEVIIQVWGDNEFTHGATVSREATITVPDIGQVVLNGLTLAQAKRLITDRLATVYSGIRARRPSTFVDVTLGKLRTIQVFLLGDVVRPGGYTISSVSTVLNALYSAGGPTPSGSMRDVRIIRHDAIYQRVDLYGYILTGSKAEDVRLQSGDVVFVPPVGKSVAVTGEVHRPAIYELRPGEKFHDLLRLSGGIRSTALLDRVQVDRVVPFSERDSLAGQDRVALDLPLKQLLANPANDPELVDRDIVQFFRIGDVRKNTVAILGDVVVHPGTFQLHNGMTVSDLVSRAGGLASDAYLERATLIRTSSDLSRSIHPFHLGKALQLDSANDLLLEELDEIHVASLWDMRDRHTVSITGSVRKPDTYEYLDGMTLTDLLFKAGGLTESASKLEAEVARVDSSTIATLKAARIFRVPISADYGFRARDTSFVLQKWDQVSVRAIPDWELQRNVTLVGEVKYPGVYAIRSKDERLSSVIARAGGLRADAYPEGATFSRKHGDVGRMAVNLEAALRGNRSQDLVLADGDAVEIPNEPRSVKVVGEVGFPASVLYENGRSLAYYIDQAGGYTERADKKRVSVIAANGMIRPARSTWGSSRPQPGALVVVPFKPKEEKSETLKDLSSIVGILSGAATTIFLVRQVTK